MERTTKRQQNTTKQPIHITTQRNHETTKKYNADKIQKKQIQEVQYENTKVPKKQKSTIQTTQKIQKQRKAIQNKYKCKNTLEIQKKTPKIQKYKIQYKEYKKYK